VYHQGRIVCIVVVAGTTARGIADLLIAATTVRVLATTL